MRYYKFRVIRSTKVEQGVWSVLNCQSAAILLPGDVADCIVSSYRIKPSDNSEVLVMRRLDIRKNYAKLLSGLTVDNIDFSIKKFMVFYSYRNSRRRKRMKPMNIVSSYRFSNSLTCPVLVNYCIPETRDALEVSEVLLPENQVPICCKWLIDNYMPSDVVLQD